MSDFERLKQVSNAGGGPVRVETLPPAPSGGSRAERDLTVMPPKKATFRTYVPLIIILSLFYTSLFVMLIVVFVLMALHG